ncbi:Fructosamine kinase-domain-containing protein [Aspergillus tetrazonus]
MASNLANTAGALTGDFPVDKNVASQFPPGSQIMSAYRFGTSAWTTTARLCVKDPDGSEKLYFLKCANGDTGRLMMEGEFNAQSELYKTMPEFVPKPYSWGEFDQPDLKTYFFLSEFVDMSDRVPEPNQLCTKLARLHRDSVSPTGMFGFHITTCQGNTPQDVSWESSWTVFFSKLLRHVLDQDAIVNGVWEDLNTLSQRALERVIPRLIGALEAEGRRIKPCLIHADLWEGNTGTSFETGRIYIFDSAAFYAHNEMETGNWRCSYNKIHNKVYTRTYLRYFAPSEPRQEWDDRIRMYSVYYNVIYSVNHRSQGTAVRQTAYDDLYYLIDKYAPFEEGSGPRRLVESDRVMLSEERDHTRA